MVNAFWLSFFQFYRFYWPSDDIRTAFNPTANGDMLAFSDELCNRLDDLQHWRFDMEFFRQFPDFADDVLPTQSVPTTLQIWSFAERIERIKRQKSKLQSGYGLSQRKTANEGRKISPSVAGAEMRSKAEETEQDLRLQAFRTPICLRSQVSTLPR